MSERLTALESSSKKAVMILIDHLGTGGAETHVLQLARHLDAQRFDITLVCLKEAGYRYDTVQRSNVTKHVCHLNNIMNPFRTLKTVFSLVRLVKAHDIRIIHTYIFNPTVVGTLVKILSGRRVKLITTRRDTGFWHSERHWQVYRMINRWAAKIACVCHAVNDVTQEKEGVSPEKLLTIYNGIDLRSFQMQAGDLQQGRHAYGIAEAEQVVGMVAIFRPEKRHDLFVEAAVTLCQQFEHVKFMLVGDGEPDIKQMMLDRIEAAGVADRFIFTGLLTDVKPVMALLDVMVLCSDYEAMSNAIVEAMAMAKPVVASRVGGNVELVDDGATGYLFEKGDAQALAERLSRVLEDSAHKQMLSRAARQKALDTFDLDVMIDKTQALYQSLIND